MAINLNNLLIGTEAQDCLKCAFVPVKATYLFNFRFEL